jgi:hypothetical protein
MGRFALITSRSSNVWRIGTSLAILSLRLSSSNCPGSGHLPPAGEGRLQTDNGARVQSQKRPVIGEENAYRVCGNLL